jgi:hypothetical protein
MTAVTSLQAEQVRARLSGRRAVFAVHNRLTTMLVALVLLLLPFQIFGIPVGTTVVDLSNVVMLVFVVVIVAGNAEVRYSRTFILLTIGFVLLQIVLFANGNNPFSRFISGTVWIVSFIMIYGRGVNVYVDSKLSYRIVCSVVGLLAVYIVFELFIQGIDRPAGFMAEPSSAGLVMLAVAAGLLIASRKSTSVADQMVMTFAAFALVFISYIIKTTHIISFALAFFLAALFSKTMNIRILLIFGGVAVGLFAVVLQDTHFRERLDLGAATSNLSLLSWLQGFDQMVESMRLFPLVGAGLGGTGYFDFQSVNSIALFEAGISELNRYDAYSGLFRIVIEVGPIVAAAILYAFGRRLIALWRATSRGLLPVCNESKYQIFLFVFAFTLIVGILLKEPTYSRSQVAVAVILFFMVPLNAYRSPKGVAALLRWQLQTRSTAASAAA